MAQRCSRSRGGQQLASRSCGAADRPPSGRGPIGRAAAGACGGTADFCNVGVVRNELCALDRAPRVYFLPLQRASLQQPVDVWLWVAQGVSDAAREAASFALAASEVRVVGVGCLCNEVDASAALVQARLRPLRPAQLYLAACQSRHFSRPKFSG